MSAALLIVEDEALIRQNLRRMLERHGHQVCEAACVDSACQHDLTRFDLIISDVRLPGRAGTTLIELARPTPVLIMTSYSDTRDAVAAMRAGAVHYLIKPFDHQELLVAIDSTLGRRQPERQINTDHVSEQTLGMIGRSPAMLKLYDEIRTVAPLSTTVLIHGESGTGKELVARALHRLSPRANRDMIAVNCASIPDSLMEDELFGHEKGAFTGANSSRKGLVEAADQSTLFLDEIGELPLDAQARLLRLLQEREIRRLGTHETRKVDIRLVAATHRNLEQMVKAGQFRADLFFRLNVVALELPPLHRRGQDLELLANTIIQQLSTRHGKHVLGLEAEARIRLQRHSWPGNIRELQNVLEYAVIMCKGDFIPAALIRLPDTLPHPIHHPAHLHTSLAFDDEIPILTETVPTQSGSLLQQQFIELVRQLEPRLNETQLAEQLGISRKTLWERRKTLGIPRAIRRKLS
ncbi:MAG: sigma-54 dependent transcriptional regulator [Pseudomonadota bacterium]|nr:sigma-54 dependent transcriptional regulator [Pseudomonadota bacterium]